MDAAQRLGWPLVNLYDLNHQYGVSLLQNTQSITNGNKLSTSVYVERNIDRPNLHVLLNTYVTRILFNQAGGVGGNPIASGVEFVRNNRTYQVLTIKCSVKSQV